MGNHGHSRTSRGYAHLRHFASIQTAGWGSRTAVCQAIRPRSLGSRPDHWTVHDLMEPGECAARSSRRPHRGRRGPRLARAGPPAAGSSAQAQQPDADGCHHHAEVDPRNCSDHVVAGHAWPPSPMHRWVQCTRPQCRARGSLIGTGEVSGKEAKCRA